MFCFKTISRPAAMVALVATLAALGGCGKEKPKSIQDITVRGASVSSAPDGKIITVAVTQDSLHEGSDITKDVLQELMENFGGSPFSEVDVFMHEKLVDKYGKETTESILKLTFPKSELEKVVFNNVVGWDILNVSQPQILGPQYLHVVESECAEENNAKYAATFCRNVLP